MRQEVAVVGGGGKGQHDTARSVRGAQETQPRKYGGYPPPGVVRELVLLDRERRRAEWDEKGAHEKHEFERNPCLGVGACVERDGLRDHRR